MTNRELLKRLQELETAERDVASSMDMPQENTANWAYAETAAIARSAILQQEEGLANYAQENEQLRAALQDLANCCGHDDDKALLLALRNAAKALVPCSRQPQTPEQT